MVKFNELRVTSDGKEIIIDVSIPDLPYLVDQKISEVYIDTQDTYSTDSGPSEKALKVYSELNESNMTKTLRLELKGPNTVPLINFSDLAKDNLLFIWIKTNNKVDITVPCDKDKIYTLGVTFNTCPMYNEFMSYVNEVSNSCSLPDNFINFFLQYKALQISINTGNYRKAIEFYNKFFKDISINNVIKNCNCNG